MNGDEILRHLLKYPSNEQNGQSFWNFYNENLHF